MPGAVSFTELVRSLFFGVVFVGILLFLSAYSFGQGSKSASCDLSGTIFDQRDAVVPNMAILFVDGTSYTSTRSDSDGRFRISMNPGRYEILLRLPYDFWVYERSRITVDCENSLSVNLYASPMCLSYGCDRIGYSFQRFKRKDLPDEPDMVIAYNERLARNNKEVYANAYLTLGPTTVFARQVVVDLKEKKVTALTGWIEKGTSRLNFDNQVIDFATEFLSGKVDSESISDKENRKRLKKLAGVFKL